MKRMLCIIFALILASCAFAEDTKKGSFTDWVYSETKEEILFRQVPWGISAPEFVAEMILDCCGQKIMSGLMQADMSIATVTMVDYFDPLKGKYDGFWENPNGIPFYDINMLADSDLRVGSYPVISVDALAIPSIVNGKASRNPEQSELVHASYMLDYRTIDDLDSAATDLIVKLCSLYGEIEGVYSSQNEQCLVWLGGANTYAMLSVLRSEDGSTSRVSIHYGKTDVAERINSLLSPSEDANSIDGL